MSAPALEHAAPRAGTLAAPRRAPPAPTALPIGRTNDPLEHEADRVAREALHLRTPGRTAGRCACGGIPGAGGECSQCRAKRLGLRRAPAPAAPAPNTVAPPVVHEALAAPGRPLDKSTRAFFEPRLGLDLGEVRVHDDSLAARSSDAVGALAYTVGSDVVFSANRHAPHTTDGRRLLAHELAHVAQRWSAPLAVRRQEPTGEAPPAAPVGTVAFERCDETQTAVFQSAIDKARTWMNDAAPRVAAFLPVASVVPGDANTNVIRIVLADNFHSTDPAYLSPVAASLASIRAMLNAPIVARCAYGECSGSDLVDETSPDRLSLCPDWFTWPDPKIQVVTIIQEIARRYLGFEVIDGVPSCAVLENLTTETARTNAAAYAVAAREIYEDGAFRFCGATLAGMLESVPATPPAVLQFDSEKAERANKLLAEPNALGWGTKLETVAGGAYASWATEWNEGNYFAFAWDVARYQDSLGWEEDGILGLATWSRIGGLGESMAGIETVTLGEAEQLCFAATEKRMLRGLELATSQGFELPEDATAETYEIILSTLESRMMDIPADYRGTGAAGALVYRGLGTFVSGEEIWNGGLRPGAAMQVWLHQDAYDLLVAGEFEEGGKKRPIAITDANFYGTSYVFVRYDTENKERLYVRHWSGSEWHDRSDWAVWIAANVNEPSP